MTDDSRMKQSGLMTHGDVKKRMVSFALPLLIGYFFQQLYNTVDALIVGNFLGPEALASITSTTSYIYLMNGFFVGFSTGAGVVISRCIGAGAAQDTEKSVHTTVAVGLLFSAALTMVGIFFSPVMLRWMGSPENVYGRSKAYLQVYFSGAAAIVMYNMFVSILRAAGDSRHPLIYLVISSVTNIVLDLFFIGVLKTDVGGAAFATVLSQMLSMVLVFLRLTKAEKTVRLHIRRIRLDRERLRQIVRYGFPTAMQGCVIDLSNILIQSYINSFGSDAMAGIGAGAKMEGFLFLPITAFAMAVTTFVSQNMGAGERDRVRKGIRFGILASCLLTELLGLLAFLLAPQLVAMFNADAAIMAFGVRRMRICTLFYGVAAFAHIASAIMRGVGRPFVPMVVMLVCWCAVRVLILLTLGSVIHDIRLIYWLYPFTWTLSAVVYAFEVRKSLRTLNRMPAGV